MLHESLTLDNEPKGMAEQSLKDKTVKGTFWSAIDNVAQYAVTFLVSIILARLLSPDDYGLIGIIAIFTAVCNALINGGFSSALIRKKDVTDDDYNTSFIINLVLSLFFYLVIFCVSPLISHFFHREELIALTRVSSLGMIIGALSLVQQARLTKRIDFKTQTKITLIASISSGVIGIVMAIFGCGVWSLVAQSLSSQLLRTIFLWFFNHWAPRLRFSTQSFKELFGFGWKVMLVGVINTTWNELYQVVVGKFYSPASLGQYTRAKQFSDLFSSNITNVVQRVSYPVLSEIQEDQSRMVAAYRRIIKMTMFVTVLCMFSLGAVSEPLLYCLIGSKWMDAAMYLPFICVGASLFPLHSINLNMLQILGRSDIFLYLEIIKKTILLIPLAIGIYVGIIPMLIANIITNIIAFFLNSFYTGKFLGYNSWMQIKDVLPSYGVAFIIAIPVWFLKYLPISNWIILPVQIVLVFLLLYISTRIARLEEVEELKGIVMNMLKK